MFAKVIIDQDAKALDRVFEYIIPDQMKVEKGMRVMVPFGGRTLQGFVVDKSEKCDYDEAKLKNITSPVEDFSAIKPQLLSLMDFMAKKNHLKLASILRLFLPSEMREGKTRDLFETYYFLKDETPQISARAKSQLSIVEELKKGEQKSAVLAEKYGYAPLKVLFEKGIIGKKALNKL